MRKVKNSARFLCPTCKKPMDSIRIRRLSGGAVVRRRVCDYCGLRLTTEERARPQR